MSENTPTLASKRDPLFSPSDFARDDEGDDALFYARDRFVAHLDARALDTVKKIIGSLLTEPAPAILDLMASWDSHLPVHLTPATVVGLGLNENELAANPALTSYQLHDLNRDPALPWPDASFDVVLNTVSVDYLTDPVAVFREAARVLKPGGLHLVIFSNRWFEPKVTRLWRAANEAERVILVEEWLRLAGGFTAPRVFVSKGQPRPAGDKYAHLGLPSDPVYAVFAERQGGDPARPERPLPPPPTAERPDPAELERRRALVAETLECPYCRERLRKWAVPQTPFTEWDNEHMYICFNDTCPYYLGGYDTLGRQGNLGSTYRLMFNPTQGSLMAIPVQSPKMLKDGIVDG
ncbi:MAG: class I SAM-dependent methyltransferase [Deltaproteobacteria bacterium]|nr:class I SAM-dependent methyltransferase [Deltaproteobacteria bacterium]